LVAETGLEGRVHFLGRRADVRQILSAFDLFVQSSFYEGMSIAMLEALAAGLPMVTTRVDGVEDVVAVDAGVPCVEKGDYQGLGQAMAQLAADPRRRLHLGKVLRRRVLDEFTVDAMCQKYTRLYRAHGAQV
jgi:glycosyltransferase involved in cell wall biosynthesis